MERIFSLLLTLTLAFPLTSSAQTANSDLASIKWAMTSGTITEAPAYEPATTSQFFEKAEITMGSELSVSGVTTSVVDNLTVTKFKQSASKSSSSDKNAVCFLLTMKDGIAFSPTKVSVKVFRCNTDKYSADAAWLCDGQKTMIASGKTPNRTDGSKADVATVFEKDLSGSPASEQQCGLRINLYGANSGKEAAIGDVQIEGTLYGTVGQPLIYNLSISVSPDGAGSVQVTPQGTSFESGTLVTLTQQATDGYVFTGWQTETGKNLSNASSYSFNIKGNSDIKATYVTKQSLMVNDYIIVSNKDEFRAAIKQVNQDKSGKRQFIFMKNGDYDYGLFYNYANDKTTYDPSVRDTIFVDNVSIIGQKATHVSHNPAPAEDNEKGVRIHILPYKEGISTTSPIVNRGTGTYLQDFTIENDYHYSGTARACCWQDEGHHTIGKNMCLLSYQDTYYPHTANGQLYWETSDIRGVVDFICGNGDVFLNKCLLTNRDREPYNTTLHQGGATLSAPYTQVEEFDQPGGHGFIFWDCTIDCESQTWDFGRGWRAWPKATFINNTLTEQARLRIGADQTKGKAYDKKLRVDTKSIQDCNAPFEFHEYNTMDENGGNNTPDTNVLTFNGGSGGSKTYETVLQASEIDRYSLRNVYPDWAPDEDCRQVTVTSVTRNGDNLSWTTDADAKAFLIEQDGDFVTIVDGTQNSYSLTSNLLPLTSKYTVRAANMMGGFGLATEEGEVTAVEAVKVVPVNVNVSVQKVIENGHLIIYKEGKKYNAVGQQKN
ncbi:MAG: hypothetical protein IKO82_04105 [Prevotella sp.]|nr:hypothetical protein [Prevotella sp.]